MKKLGVVIIIKKQGQYLLVKQNKYPYKNFWGPVHGKVEQGETVNEAIIRETKEETNISVKPLKKLWTSNADYGVNKLQWWLAEPITENINVDTREISEHGYFSLKNLLRLKLFPMTQQFFANRLCMQ